MAYLLNYLTREYELAGTLGSKVQVFIHYECYIHNIAQLVSPELHCAYLNFFILKEK